MSGVARASSSGSTAALAERPKQATTSPETSADFASLLSDAGAAAPNASGGSGATSTGGGSRKAKDQKGADSSSSASSAAAAQNLGDLARAALAPSVGAPVVARTASSPRTASSAPSPEPALAISSVAVPTGHGIADEAGLAKADPKTGDPKLGDPTTKSPSPTPVAGVATEPVGVGPSEPPTPAAPVQAPSAELDNLATAPVALGAASHDVPPPARPGTGPAPTMPKVPATVPVASKPSAASSGDDLLLETARRIVSAARSNATSDTAPAAKQTSPTAPRVAGAPAVARVASGSGNVDFAASIVDATVAPSSPSTTVLATGAHRPSTSSTASTAPVSHEKAAPGAGGPVASGAPSGSDTPIVHDQQSAIPVAVLNEMSSAHHAADAAPVSGPSASTSTSGAAGAPDEAAPSSSFGAFATANPSLLAGLSRPLAEGNGTYSIRAQLHPADLGHLDAVVRVSDAGVEVALNAANPVGHAVLSAHLDQLREALSSGGSAVVVSLGQSGSGGANHERPTPTPNGVVTAPEGGAPENLNDSSTGGTDRYVIL